MPSSDNSSGDAIPAHRDGLPAVDVKPWLVVLWLALGASTVAAEDLSNDACLACHGIAGFAAPSGKPLAIEGERFTASVHGPLPCTTCHADITDLPHPEHVQPVTLDTCSACHDDAVAAYRRGLHGRAHANGAGEAPTCTSCHGNIHTVLPHTDPASSAHWSKLAATCAQCHAKIELARKFGVPVVRPVEAYLDSVHARAVETGQHGAVCSDCHGVHDILPAVDPQSPIAHTNVPTTCGKCHSAVLDVYRTSVHGVALAQGHRDAPVCTDCHGEHRILGTQNPKSPVFAANLPVHTCGRCHGDQRLGEKYGLTLGNVSAFRDSFHGLALRAGRLTVANCASCHGVHDILPSSDPRSRVNPANLAATCAQCHPGAGTYFGIGAVHGQPSSTGARAVAWVRFLYVWLIGVTIGGMALHNFLDLMRKARSDTPPHAEYLASAPERMTRGLRWQHGLVMVSFAILVYTGFGLTYPESWWAAPLLRWEERYALRGILHRAAAVILLVALAWHLGQLALSPRLRAVMRAMLPTRGDAAQLLSRFAYYAGRRATPPRGGTFNYAEKAEYWAFMWGVGLMSVTGILLWFANTTLRYLPTWVLDLATAVHFYEAVLATLSILVWHFYWVIFDPEVYPMDWTWWTGRPPAARVHERQPADAEDTPEAS
jgi:cytochrome b subunit of formate dehydrogenase